MNMQLFAKTCSLIAFFCCFNAVFADEGSAKRNEDEYHYLRKNSHPPVEERRNGRQIERSSYFNDNGYTHLNIPKKHYPRPGECRVWYPNRHRSARIRCDQAPPRGAWLIQQPKNRPNHVYVKVYEPQRRGVVFSIGEFEIRSGAFLREMPRR